ncbi:MAG: hypothetical protein KAI79_19485, partial [Bacteroidales bacterium]|nr:hypothetical protein [Bacteroidales bacterium]
MSYMLTFFLTKCHYNCIGIHCDKSETNKTKITQIMSNIGIKPLGTRVVVNPIEAETVTSGGLIIPDSAQEKQAKGVIVATA